MHALQGALPACMHAYALQGALQNGSVLRRWRLNCGHPLQHITLTL